MKKSGLIIVAGAVVVIALVAGGFMLTRSKDDQNSTNGSGSASVKKFSPPQACDVLTQEIATQALGSAEKGELPVSGAASDDIEVSQCIYSQPSGGSIESIKTRKQASILVRGAKTQVGADSNKDVFSGSARPAAAQDVSGYGDAAFWNPEYGQFNVLKNGNWYIITHGVNDVKQKTLDDAKKLTDLLEDKL